MIIFNKQIGYQHFRREKFQLITKKFKSLTVVLTVALMTVTSNYTLKNATQKNVLYIETRNQHRNYPSPHKWRLWQQKKRPSIIHSTQQQAPHRTNNSTISAFSAELALWMASAARSTGTDSDECVCVVLVFRRGDLKWELMSSGVARDLQIRWLARPIMVGHDWNWTDTAVARLLQVMWLFLLARDGRENVTANRRELSLKVRKAVFSIQQNVNSAI